MNPFDRSILEFFNRFSQKSWTFDQAMYLLTDTELFKGEWSSRFYGLYGLRVRRKRSLRKPEEP